MSVPYKLYEGDNLAVMRGLPSESIDLIYIDPPYFSQRNYGDFDDRWKSMQHYLDFMVERLKEMHRLLKPTGSIYVHLDWHAVHYVKVEMDKIFGYENFRNSIVWAYSGWNKKLPKNIERRHDDILFYTKTEDFSFYYPSRKWESESEYLKTRKQKIRQDEFGKFVFSNAGNGKKMKRYLEDAMEYGKPLDDVWSIGKMNSSSKNYSYATQKPAELMERIILASSNEGDLVADFFCGSGSFIKKAFELGRRCIGVDVSPKALALAHCPTPLALDGGDSAAFQVLSTPEVLSTLQGESTPAHRK